MRVGVTLPQFRDEIGPMMAAAASAEEAGLDGVFVFDHLFPLGATAATPAQECFASLGAIAAATQSIDVGTLVVRSTLRPPAVAATAIRTAARIAGERFIAGIGAGDGGSTPEFVSYQLEPPDERERLAALESLADELAGSPFPLWIGGLHAGVRRIAARHATAWNVWGLTPDEVASHRALLNEDLIDAACAGMDGLSPSLTWGGQVAIGTTTAEAQELASRRAKARGPLESDTLVGDAATVAETLNRLESAGVTYCVFSTVGASSIEELARCHQALAGARELARG